MGGAQRGLAWSKAKAMHGKVDLSVDEGGLEAADHRTKGR
jgi:hypothetical protein